MRSQHIALAALLIGLQAMPLHAQAPSDSTDRFSFDLDTQGGHFSRWTLNTLRHSCLHARLIIGELRKTGPWGPAYQLWLVSGDHLAAIRMWAPTGKPPLDVVYLVGAGAFTDSVSFDDRLKRDDTVHVDLNWSRAGNLRATVDRHIRDLPLPFRPDSFVVISTSGQLKADSLVFYDCQ